MSNIFAKLKTFVGNFFKSISLRSVSNFFSESIVTFGIDYALDYLDRKLEELGVPTVIRNMLIWTIRIGGVVGLAWFLGKSIPIAIVSCCALKLLKIVLFKLFPSLEKTKNDLHDWILSTFKEKYDLLEKRFSNHFDSLNIKSDSHHEIDFSSINKSDKKSD